MNEKIFANIKGIADVYASKLKKQVDLRIEEMRQDETFHYLLYRVLGITDHEGELIDIY